MGTIFCIVGKSSSGKDTIYKKLLENSSLQLQRIVPYTTRPVRAGECEGVEYHFTTVDAMERLQDENKIIECRSYETVYGVWYYFMAKDRVVPIYIDLDDGERLSRALRREKKQSQPRYEEMCRRYLADAKDFSLENLEQAGITRCFNNHNLKKCYAEISEYIKSY